MVSLVELVFLDKNEGSVTSWDDCGLFTLGLCAFFWISFSIIIVPDLLLGNWLTFRLGVRGIGTRGKLALGSLFAGILGILLAILLFKPSKLSKDCAQRDLIKKWIVL